MSIWKHVYCPFQINQVFWWFFKTAPCWAAALWSRRSGASQGTIRLILFHLCCPRVFRSTCRTTCLTQCPSQPFSWRWTWRSLIRGNTCSLPPPPPPPLRHPPLPHATLPRALVAERTTAPSWTGSGGHPSTTTTRRPTRTKWTFKFL